MRSVSSLKSGQSDEINRELYVRNAELAVRNKTLSLLRKIDDVTMTALETREMTHEIINILSKEFLYPFVAIGICDAARKHLEWMAVACLNHEEAICRPEIPWKPLSLTNRTNASIQALLTNKQVIVPSLALAVGPSVPKEATEHFDAAAKIQSVLIFPLSAGKQCIGVFVIGLKRPRPELTPYAQETFTPMVSLVTIAIQKAQTYTSLVVATDKLKSANRKLKELDSLKTEFLSIATHQLRTPLAVMKGYTTMLTDGMLGKISAKQRGALTTVQTSNDQLILLVNHLLDLTRIESKRLQVKIEPVDLDAIVRWTVEFMRPRATENHLALEVKSAKIPLVLADPEKLKEVIMNLVDNAVKYTEKGGVTVTMGSEDSVVFVQVRDTGYGLTPHDQERMFEMFSTGSASKHVKTTSGVGLYVCRKLMDAMHGTIQAESHGKGRGSTFTIRIPVAV